MDRQDSFSLWRSIDPAVLITPLLGFLLFSAGLFTMYFLGKVSNLTCTRDVQTGVNCSLVTTWMGLTQLSDKPLANLNSAYVQDSCDEDGCTYRVMLSTSREDLPLISTYSSGKADKQKIVGRIKSFLADDSQSSLQVSYGGGLFLLIPLFFLAAGLWMSISSLISLFSGKAQG